MKFIVCVSPTQVQDLMYLKSPFPNIHAHTSIQTKNDTADLKRVYRFIKYFENILNSQSFDFALKHFVSILAKTG